MDTIKEAICVLVRAYRIKGDIPKFFGYALLKDTATVSSEQKYVVNLEDTMKAPVSCRRH